MHLHLTLTFVPDLKGDFCPLHCSTEDTFLKSAKGIESIN